MAGTFEHARNWLVDHELDLTGFDVRYRNDINGAPAYLLALLLTVALVAYSRGMVSSRQIEAACGENVTFVALSEPYKYYLATPSSKARYVISTLKLMTRWSSQSRRRCNGQSLI